MKNLFTILSLFMVITAGAQSEGTFTMVNTNGSFSGGFGVSGIRIRQGTSTAYTISYTLTQQADTHGFLQINGTNNKGIKIGSTKIWSDLPWAIGGSKIATGYQLSVHGKIICAEAWVKPIGDWPDYVFSKNYDLPSLSDVEQYIQANSHLPGVPSAAEIEENNLNLGEMNAILLKKIEEITLYLIEANKESTRMKEEIAQLKKANEQLQQQLTK